MHPTGATMLIIGDVASIPDPDKPLTVRVHDECARDHSREIRPWHI